MKISVSYLGTKKITDTLRELDKTDVDYIHVDVMDGKYVKNKTMNFSDLKEIGYYTKKRLDIHFMVNKPLKYIDDYASLNASYMSFHLDTKNSIEEIIKRTKMYGIKVGLVLNPDDNVELVFPYLEQIDLVLIMTVIPGLPGQKLIEDVIPKIYELKKEIKRQKLDVLVSVDGGINLDTKELVKGVDIIVSGSCVTKSDNYQKIITKLREEIGNKNKK